MALALLARALGAEQHGLHVSFTELEADLVLHVPHDLYRVAEAEAGARGGGQGEGDGGVRGDHAVGVLAKLSADQVHGLSTHATGTLVEDDVLGAQRRDDLAGAAQERALAHVGPLVEHVLQGELGDVPVGQDLHQGQDAAGAHEPHAQELPDGRVVVALEHREWSGRRAEPRLVRVVDRRVAVDGRERQLGQLHGVDLALEQAT